MVCVASVEEGVVADACEELILVPDDLGTSEIVGVTNLRNRGGAPGGIDGVSVLSASDFWGVNGLLPIVDERPAGSH